MTQLTPQSQRILERFQDEEFFHEEVRAAFRELLLLVQAQTEALAFECGNRCAQQNPCNAKEALAHADEVMKRLGGAG